MMELKFFGRKRMKLGKRGPRDAYRAVYPTRTADVRDGLVTVTDATGKVIAIIDPHTRIRTEVS